MQITLSPVPEADKYELLEPFVYSYSSSDGDKKITVPAGFLYDGASIPSIAQPLTYTPFLPKVMLAALVHDYLYTTGEVRRIEADSIFFQLLIDSGVPRLTAELMYTGVRIGGGGHYTTD